MKLFNNPRRAIILLGFLTISLAIFSVTLYKSQQYSATSGNTKYQPRSAQSFVQSIGVTTHLTYSDYITNDHYADVFNSLVKPKIRELGIYHVRQYPSEVHSNFNTFVAKFNELANPPAGYPKMIFNFETNVDSTVSSNPQHICYLPKMKYIWFGIVGNCSGLQNYTAPSSVVPISVENPNEPDHCASFICKYSPSPSNWYAHSLQQNPNWPDDVLQTAQATYTKLTNDPQTASFERLAPAFVWLPYHQNETYNGVNLRTYLEPHKTYVTHGNAHPYCNLQTVATCFTQQVKPIVDYYSPKPVIVTETGHSTAQFTELQQAKYILRILFDFFERGIPRTYIYELLDEPSIPTATQQNFGLVNEDGREKPAYIWLKNTLGLLKDNVSVTLKPLEMNISGTGLRQTLLQKSDGSHWLALQYDKANTTDANSTTTATINFSSVKNIEYYSPNSTTAYKTENGVTSISFLAPDLITLIKISDPVSSSTSSNTNSNYNTNSSSNTNSTATGTTQKPKTSSSSTAAEQPITVTEQEAQNGIILDDSTIQLTKNTKVNRTGFIIGFIATILIIASVAVWLRLRKKIYE